MEENRYWNIGKEDVSYVPKSAARMRNPNWTEVVNQLVHVESELCWCDPIVEMDEYGQKVVLHKAVTWH
jgi:hypothetical protein